jgi:hypothetical protein
MLKNLLIGAGALVLVVIGLFVFVDLSNKEAVETGPFAADGECPVFEADYPRCEITFGNRGLSVLNSAAETFLGEGAFEIDSFRVENRAAGRFVITAQSNRGPLTSDIFADRVVRLGQDQEDGVLRLTQQSAFCDGGRIFEQQVRLGEGKVTGTQRLEYWTEGDVFNFKLIQNGSKTAEVQCFLE